MFERFTGEARQTVVDAQEEARRLHADHIGTEHLLLALLARTGSVSASALTVHGLTRNSAVQAIRGYGTAGLDAEALTTLGIDLDAVRDRVEATFGPGALDGAAGRRPVDHLPFTPRAKKVLELALREAIALKHRHIADGHIALGLLREGEGLAMRVLADREIDTTALRRDLIAALTS